VLVESKRLVQLILFENEEFIFSSVHHSFRFCLLVVGAEGACDRSAFAFFLRQPDVKLGAIHHLAACDEEPSHRHSRRQSSSSSLANSGWRMSKSIAFISRGAAQPHFQVHERRVARFEVAERIGGGGDLVGLRSKPPFIGGTSEGKRSVHFLLST
jgi:hypothetical protein